jgi:hypothetical protein
MGRCSQIRRALGERIGSRDSTHSLEVDYTQLGLHVKADIGAWEQVANVGLAGGEGSAFWLAEVDGSSVGNR